MSVQSTFGCISMVRNNFKFKLYSSQKLEIQLEGQFIGLIEDALYTTFFLHK